MPLLTWLGVGALAIIGFAWWARRRWIEVDSYYERERRDPPIFDVGSWLGGNRW